MSDESPKPAAPQVSVVVPFNYKALLSRLAIAVALVALGATCKSLGVDCVACLFEFVRSGAIVP